MKNKIKVHEGVFSPDSARKMTKFLDGWAQSLNDRLNRNGSTSTLLNEVLKGAEFQNVIVKLNQDAAKIDKMTDYDAMVSANRNVQAITPYFNAVIKFQKEEDRLATQGNKVAVMSDINVDGADNRATDAELDRQTP